jgi:hypothetical protein
MIGRSQLVEQLQDGRRVFSVRFSRPQMRAMHVPTTLLNMLEEEPDTFLEEAPLTSLLTAEEREALLAKSAVRSIMPNEVIVWQGDHFKEIGLLRIGLLKRSRIKKTQRKQAVEYVRRSEWFGLGEVLGSYPSLDTYTAVTDSELLVWPAEEFLNFLRHNSNLSMAVNSFLSLLFQQCQNQRVQGAGRLWVVESVEYGVGATTFASNLALLVSRNGADGTRPRVALWNAHDDGQDMVKALGLTMPSGTMFPGQAVTLEHQSGVEVVLRTEKDNYPPQVQLDIILADLQNRYDYIICDTGHRQDDELLQRLRGQAEPLITITHQSAGAKQAMSRWGSLQAYARPGQKRLLMLNKIASNGSDIDPAFHLVLPYDPESLMAAGNNRQALVEALPHSSLSQALREAYRRLSLNHVVGIFVPSTLDVDQAVDNKAQVQEVLSFFGSIFGGATSSDAEGCWQSEDGGLVVEQVTIVRTFVSKKALDQHLDDVISFATKLKKEMRQEAVAVDVDNQLILV